MGRPQECLANVDLGRDVGLPIRRLWVANPYLKAHRMMRKHQGFRLHRWVPVLATVAMLPLVTSSLFGFLPEDAAVPVSSWADRLSMVVSRMANLIAAAVILHSYSDLVRGPDRAVLDVHPVRAKALVTAIA